MGSIAAMQDAARRIDAANTGYDQSGRWTFFDRPTLQIIPNQEADCSSACAAIIALGGYPIDLGYPSHSGVYTGNFAAAAVQAGFTLLPFTGLSDLQAGDFVCRPGAHVEFVYSASPLTFFSLWIDDNGNATGGRSGDQTGGESRFTKGFNYSGGWTQVVRPPLDTPPKKEGFLMSLSDAEQAKVAARIKNIQDILTGFTDNPYVKKGANFPEVANNVRVTNMRVRQLKDYETQGGPDGNAETISTKILAKLDGIEARLDRLENKEA